MKIVIANWKDLLYPIRIEDIKGKQWEGKIYSCDEIGVALEISNQKDKSIVLLTWGSIYNIERC